MKLPYYIKQRIVKRAIDIFMVAFLIVTLFPIAWMVFSSFKNNTEILLGRIPFGRASNDVISITSFGKDLFLLTSDGGVNKVDLNSNKIIQHRSVKSMATNFMADDGYIWVSTADKGLIRMSASDLSDKKVFDTKIDGIDVNKVVSTHMSLDRHRLWLAVEQRGIEKIFEFDKDEQKFTREFDLSGPLSPFSVSSIVKAGPFLWAGSNKGLMKIDLSTGRVSRSVSLAAAGINANEIRGLSLRGDQLLVSTLSGLYEFSTSSLYALGKYDINSGLLSNRVNSAFYSGGKIYVQTNLGLSIIDQATKKIRNIENVFLPTQGSSEKGFVSSDIFSVLKSNNDLYLGSSAGRASIVDELSGKVKASMLAKEGHILVRWRNYVDLWKNINFALYLRNSFLICGTTMMLAMIFATLAAYALARFDFPGSKFFSIGVLATQMIPSIMYLIPIYIMFVQFALFTGIALKGSFVGLILIYTAFFTPFSIWILRGFFAAIPVELEEAARIDGCSPFMVFWYIALPLAVPGIIATGIYVFLNAWDELMFAWVLTNADTMTIPVGIRLFVGNYQNRFDLMMAAATVATIPVMILFFMLQKYIVKGLTAGAVKG